MSNTEYSFLNNIVSDIPDEPKKGGLKKSESNKKNSESDDSCED